MDLEPGYTENSICQEQPDRMTVQLLMKILAIGSNLGSAMASSMLFQTQIWPVLFVIFVLSSGAIMLQEIEKIKAWGWVTAILSAVSLGIVLVESGRREMPDFRPWLPVIAAVLLHLTAFGMPRIHQALYPVAEDDLDSMADSHTDGSRGNPRGARPLYVQSDASAHTRADDDQTDRLMLDHLVSNMSHLSPSRLSQRQSQHSTEIELEPPESTNIALRRIVSLPRDVDFNGILAIGDPNIFNPGEGTASGHPDSFRGQASHNVLKPTSEPLGVSASISAKSDCPLL